MKKTNVLKSFGSLLLAFSIMLCTVVLPCAAETANAIDVFVTAEALGGFMAAPQKVSVTPDLAESYGYSDNITDGVSALDALVKIHEIIFGNDYTKDTKNDYLDVDNGTIKTVFGIQTYGCGYFINDGYPNDGTPAVSGGGYNGTMISSQQIYDNDKVLFFVYRDTSFYSDYYTWIDGKLSAAPGSTASISISGSMAIGGYLYKTPKDFKESAEPMEGVSLAWIDENGACDEISDIRTDKDGRASFSVPENMSKGVHYITAIGTDDNDSFVVMNPFPFVVADEFTVSVSISRNGDFVRSNDNKPVDRLPVTLQGKAEYTIDDCLYAAHKEYGNANDYGAQDGTYGLSITSLWGDQSGVYGYYLNDGIAMSLGDKVSDGDYISAYVYMDQSGYSDAYAKFDNNSNSTMAGVETTLTLKKYSWSDNGYIPCSGAKIYVEENSEPNGITDENGNFRLTFPSEGEYIIIAKSGDNQIIVPTSCRIEVGKPIAVTGITTDKDIVVTEGASTVINHSVLPENATNKSVLWSTADSSIASVKDGVVTGLSEGETNITAKTVDGNFEAVCKITVNKRASADVIAENIVSRYTKTGISTDMNMAWLAADMSAYAALQPDKDKLSKEQVQECLNQIISSVDSSNSASEIAKNIIALRALGYDAETLVTADFREINAYKKLIEIINSNDAAAKNIYTLPYVIIALNQDESYKDSELIKELIVSAKEQKSAWQDTKWGIDGAAPMVLALSPYCNDDKEIKSALDETVDIIKSVQGVDGSVGNAASTGLAITAFSALGIDSDEIKKEEKSLIDGLMSYTNDNADGFKPENNSFATEQGFRGLVSWQIFKETNKARSIYDFSKNSKCSAAASWGEYCPVSFDIIPSDAEVIIEGKTGISKNRFDLPEGEYTYTVEKNGYVSETGIVTVSAEEEAKHTPKTIKLSLLSKPSHGSGNITVDISVMTHSKDVCDGKYTYKDYPSKYTALAAKKIKMNSGQTVFDALAKLLADNDISYTEKTFGYISAIGSDTEFDHGPNSGWMFIVDGDVSQKGCRDVKLTKDSSVIWFYTDDYTNELGAQRWHGGGRSNSLANDKITVNFETNGGNRVAAININKNTAVTEPTTPIKEGWIFKGWYKDERLTKIFDFSEKLSENTTLYAKWDKIEAFLPKFDDVKNDDWFFDAVKFVDSKKLMRGTESGFEPNLSVTRAMLVTILYRMADEPIVDENTVFNDVKDGEWYTSAVAWASKNGIVYGISENEFAPDIDITREELSTMLYRFAGYEKYDLTAADENNFNKYDDGNIVSDYAVKAVNWCIACGIINGRTDRTIAPKDNAIRAELAVIVMRFYEHVK